MKINHLKFALALSLSAATPVMTLTTSGSAMAQTVIASVNDDPITNVDVDQHMKILRVLRRPATHEASLEDIIETRLKLIETSKFKINPGDPEIGFAIGVAARAIKMEPQPLLVAMQRSGVTEDQWKQKFKSDAAWITYVRALNRTLEVSESEVRNELARQGKSQSTEFTVRQVILVVPNNSNVATLGGRFKDAQQLRAKFTDCASGVELVRNTRDAAMKEPVTRSASALGDQLRKILEATPVGHLTQPSRGAQGVEMLAVCGKSNREDSAAADTLRNELITKRLEGESQRLYREVRAKAVIVKK